MITDIDRLHDVVEGKIDFRGCGKTFAKCHEVAGFIELDIKYIFCVVTNYRDWMYLNPMIIDVMNEHGIPFSAFRQSSMQVYYGRSVIKFVTEENLDQAIRGYQECAIVWMRHWD